jgi:hypothetical protein
LLSTGSSIIIPETSLLTSILLLFSYSIEDWRTDKYCRLTTISQQWRRQKYGTSARLHRLVAKQTTASHSKSIHADQFRLYRIFKRPRDQFFNTVFQCQATSALASHFATLILATTHHPSLPALSIPTTEFRDGRASPRMPPMLQLSQQLLVSRPTGCRCRQADAIPCQRTDLISTAPASQHHRAAFRATACR